MLVSLLSLLAVFATVNSDFTEENGVIVLTDANFEKVLEKHDNVMVMFYAPWCGHCNAFKPAYEEAAKALKENKNVILAKLDATENKDVAEKYKITGYPTVKLFRKDDIVDFNAGRDTSSVVNWIRRKLEPPVITLKTVEETKAFIESGNLNLIAFAKREMPDLTAILTKLADLDRASIGFSSSPEVLKEYGIEVDATVALFRKFDEPRVDYVGDFNIDKMERFIMVESIPLIVDFNPQQASEVFGSPIKKHVVVFAKKPDSYDKIKQSLQPVATNFKGRMHFVLIDISDENNHRVLEFFGLSESDVPLYRVIDLEEDMAKFKPETNDLSESALTKFLEDILSGALKPYLMSEEIPPESDDPVKVLVGKNFNEFVKDKSTAVFALMYAPWCGHCKQLMPIWDELGKMYKDRKDIAIIKMDSTANEAEGLKILSFPTLKYYGKDTDDVVEYSGERTLEALSKFVESEGKVSDDKPSEDDEHKKDEL